MTDSQAPFIPVEINDMKRLDRSETFPTIYNIEIKNLSSAGWGSDYNAELIEATVRNLTLICSNRLMVMKFKKNLHYKIILLVVFIILGIFFNYFLKYDNTIFGEDFSFSGYLKIENGINEAEVERLLGKSLSINKNEHYYSKPDKPVYDYILVSITFSKSGTVTAKLWKPVEGKP